METRVDGTFVSRTFAAGIRSLIAGLALLAGTAMGLYLTVRIVLLHKANYQGIEIPVSIMLLLAEGFVLLHAFGYVVSLIRAMFNRPQVPAAVLRDPASLPLVDVLMPARHESKQILERSLTALTGMHYPQKNIWLLDDSSDPQFQREAEELARKFNVRLFRRDARHGAKAGIINDCLKQLTGKYVAVFDADQNPMPFFLKRIVPLLEANEKLAFVQTPQFYANIRNNRVARAAGAQQAVFYEYICEAKSASGAAFCCGTNVVLRREALQGVGGMDESSVTEDFATSIKMHMAGWKSLYYGEAYAMGLGPETLPAYFRQQFRWARGTLGVGLRLLGLFLRHPTALRPMQWFDYALSGSFYLVGWAYLVLMLCPMLYVFFGIPSYLVRPELYLAAFLPYLTFAAMAFIGGLRRRHYTFGQLVQGQLLGLLATPVHMRASLAALLGSRTAFGITPKGVGQVTLLRDVSIQLLLCMLNYLVFIAGMCRYIFEGDIASAINGFWAGVHFAAFFSLFYFRDSQEPVKQSEARPLQMEAAVA